MKKSLVGIALLGSFGLVGTASAVDASQTFTWTGTVPAAPTVSGWVIASPTGAEIGSGILSFTAGASGKGELKSSTELLFNVFKESTGAAGTPDTAAPAATYDYKLVSLAVNANSFANEQGDTGYFAIEAINNGDTVTLVKNTAQTAAAGETILRVVKGAGVSNQPNAGDSVDIQASIVIENATSAI
jgi:hypothetical protein